MTKSIIASAAIYWYLTAKGQDACSLETAAGVLECTVGQLAKVEFDKRIRMTKTTIKLASAKGNRAADRKIVFNHWVTSTGRTSATKMLPERQRLIDAAFRNGYSVEQLCWAIDGLCLSDWHMGRNPKTHGKRFDELKYAIGKGSTIEQRIEEAGHGRQVTGQKASETTSFDLEGADKQINDLVYGNDANGTIQALANGTPQLLAKWVPLAASWFKATEHEIRRRVAEARR